jgi:hypothetical protein
VEAFSAIIFGDLRDEDNLVGHFSCPRCYMPSAAVLQNTSGQLSLTSLWNENYKGDPTTVGWEIFKFWPSPQPVPPPFSDEIRSISATFCIIYGEAHQAEHFGLTQICGVGYRKSLEFLIKDYLIHNRPSDKASIEATMLGPCIDKYVTDPRTKQVAQRATWLGNDETHYQRRWIGKDVQDLKLMINLVIHWIEAEHLTAEALNSMPAPTKPKK